MEPRQLACAFLGILCLLTCMQLRMPNLFQMHCIYSLHNLNVQLALLDHGHQVRQRRRRRWNNPYRWRLPRPNVSWFEIHFRKRGIPSEYFNSQLWMTRDTFEVLVHLLHPYLMRQNTTLQDCVPPEKVLALGLYRLAHRNSCDNRCYLRCRDKYHDQSSARCYWCTVWIKKWIHKISSYQGRDKCLYSNICWAFSSS